MQSNNYWSSTTNVNNTSNAWNVNFNMNKEILYRIITKRIKDEAVLWLAGMVIFHDCTKDFIFKGKKDLLKVVPLNKTLFNTENKRGLPIGNLTSQFFANVYLNELDQFVKHHLKARYYVRYCDDFVLLDETKERLLEWREKIVDFLEAKLQLVLNDRRETLGPISNGINFLGYIVRSDYLLVRRRVVNSLRARLIEYQKKLIVEGKDCTIFNYDLTVSEKLRDTWASYMAHFKMANTYRLNKALAERFSWIGHLFYHDKGKLKIVDRAPARLRTLKGQYRFFIGKFPGAMLFFQVGRFFEFYDEQAENVMEVLGLSRMKITRRFRIRCGFPVSLKERYLGKFMNMGFSVYHIKEEDGWLSAVKKRRVAKAWIPKFQELVDSTQTTEP